MRTILAFDPAAERAISDTGYAVLRYTDTAEAEVVASGVIHGGFDGFSRAVRKPEFTVGALTYQPDVVVCEKFVKYRAVADPTPLLVEGVIRHIWPEAVLQRANEKEIASKTRLKKLGVWSSEGHHADAGSAVQHAYAYLLRQRHEPTIRLFSPPRPTPPQ